MNGIKRHVGVASLGLPQVIHVTTANVTDREVALEMFQWHSDSWPAVTTVLADGGSTGENLATGVRDVLSARVDMANRAELHTFVVIPKRWVVERSFAWKDQVSPTLETWGTAVEYFSSKGRVGVSLSSSNKDFEQVLNGLEGPPSSYSGKLWHHLEIKLRF